MDGHLLVKRHTTINQITVSVIGGGVVTRCDRGRMCGGDYFTSFGAVNEGGKIKQTSVRGLSRWPPDEDFTQQPTKNTQA